MKAKLSESEKDILALICQKLVTLNQQSRRLGLLPLEDEIYGAAEELSGKNGQYIRKLLPFVVDAYDTDTINAIADNYIHSSCGSEFEVLCFTLIKTGVCAIQARNHPALLTALFISYISFDGEENFRQRTGFVKEITF